METHLLNPDATVLLSEALKSLYVIDGDFPFYCVETGTVTSSRKGFRPISGFELAHALDCALKQRDQLEQAIGCMQALLDGRPPNLELIMRRPKADDLRFAAEWLRSYDDEDLGANKAPLPGRLLPGWTPKPTLATCGNTPSRAVYRSRSFGAHCKPTKVIFPSCFGRRLFPGASPRRLQKADV